MGKHFTSAFIRSVGCFCLNGNDATQHLVLDQFGMHPDPRNCIWCRLLDVEAFFTIGFTRRDCANDQMLDGMTAPAVV